MKPEQRLSDAMNCGTQVIAAANVFKLMRDDRPNMHIVQLL
jgi:hypothetical protein